ncbi:class I SAM-dependent methyltransferase [Synechococcus sp. CB0101]|uniref:class I SAM-dependent methyltransferase n=1 Tax=Synechococcus sp. CB0101 TaxID=232348 RepID=UPI0002001316|nr:class I SAM-dependent methyltransferase [Synechococcus sp. CB0101]QCH14831.1 class I SAM-dependent methyltransferase [Synechococcus sp. CB0101]
MPLLDFDGDYGRTYDARIATLIPAYEAIFELAAAATAALQPLAQQALVVGAGTGTELPGLLAAMPQALFTLVEPSAQMRGFCQALIERVGASDRVTWGPDDLDALGPTCFDAVISHNVLHVLTPDAQERLLQQMAERVAPGGCLLLSSYSETEPPELELGLQIGVARFKALGMDPATIEAVMAARNSKVFSVNHQRLEAQLLQAGLEPPIQLVQALFNRLWLSRRCEGGATA